MTAPILTPLALTNAEVLRAIRDHAFDTVADLARLVDRDPDNLRKSLKAMDKAGLIQLDGGPKFPRPVLVDLGHQALEALDRAEAPAPSTTPAPATATQEGFGKYAIALIDRDPSLNPRTIFDDEKLEALAASIRDKGVAQPILIRQGLEPGRFRIVAGERRWRASQKAGRTTIPAMYRELTDDQALELATIENIQRDDLTPLEEARAFKAIVEARMRNDPDLALKDAKETIAQAVRKTVRYVEQRMDLLELPPGFHVRLELDKDHDNHLSLKEARNEVQRVRREAREREARKVSDAELLALAEIYHATKQFPAELEGWYYSARPVPIGFRALEDGEVVMGLINREMLELTAGHRGDPRNFVRLNWRINDQRLEEYAPGLTKAKTVATVLQSLRIRVCGAEEAERLGLTWGATVGTRGEYATWALNEPFISTPDPSLEEEAAAWREAEAKRQAETFNRQAEQRAREEEARAKREAEQAQIDRDVGDEGRAFYEAVRTLEADAPAMDHAQFTAAFAAVYASYGVAGPFTLVLAEDGRTPDTVDGNGRNTLAAAFALEARRRLVCIATNYALGLPVQSGPDLDLPHHHQPVPPEAQAETDESLSMDDFLRHIVDSLVEDMEVDEETAETYARRGLAHFLASEEIEFGDDGYAWDREEAEGLAQAIGVHGYGLEDDEDQAPADPADDDPA